MTGARLRLADDAYYAETADGLNVLTGRGLTRITGASIARWLDRLAPHLDGSSTLTELTAGLPCERRRFVERLVSDLVGRGVIREVAPETPLALSPAELSGYRPEIGFVEGFRSAAATAFARYRNGLVAVVGSASLTAATVQALLLSGARTVRVVAGPDDADTAGLGSLDHRDPEQRIEWRIAGAFTTEPLADADVIVQLADGPAVDWAEPLERFCAESGRPLVQAIRLGTEVWMSHPGGPVWSHAWRRLAGLGTAEAADAADAGEPVAEADATVVAGQLVHGLFGHVTGAGPTGGPGRITRIELGTLNATSHRLLPHPLAAPTTAGDAAAAEATFTRLDEGPVLDREDFDRSAAALMASRVGVFTDVGEDDAAQLPLHLARTTVADPAGLLGPGTGRPLAIGFGPDLPTARRRAAFRALETYGSLMVDPRRIVDGRVWGIDLAVRRPVAVPAERAFPALRRTGTDPFRVPTGVAAGYSWAEALRVGLLRHCAELTVAGADPVPEPIDLTAFASPDETIVRHRSLLEAIGADFAGYDVTGPLGVPVHAGTLAGRVVAHGCGASAEDALRDVLERMLFHHQTGTAMALDKADPAPPGRGTAGLTVPALVEAIAGTGRRVFAVPLDHDPELHKVMPYLVHVVVSDDDR